MARLQQWQRVPALRGWELVIAAISGLLLFQAQAAYATNPQFESCMVFGVSDGDTIRVRCGEGEQQRVRLAEIDAPESKQPFGQRSRQRLSDLIFRQEVQLEVIDLDRYGRLVARIHHQGAHINFQLVEECAFRRSRPLIPIDAGRVFRGMSAA